MGKLAKRAKKLAKSSFNITRGIVALDGKALKKGVKQADSAVGASKFVKDVAGLKKPVDVLEDEGNPLTQLPDTEEPNAASEEAGAGPRKGRRRRRSSILTGSSGLLDKANTAGKRLLGT